MRALLVIIGVIAGLTGLYCGGSGFVTYRAVDADGYITSDRGIISSGALAVTARADEIETQSENLSSGSAIIRARAQREDGGAVFVGIGRADLVQAYLLGSRYDALTDIQFSPFEYNARTVPGRSTDDTLTAPELRSDVWVASAAGEGSQEATWSVIKDEEGEVIDYLVVIMNAEPSAGVAVEAELGVKYPRLRGTGIAFMVVGTLVFLFGALLVVLPLRAGGGEAEEEKPRPEPEPPLFG